MMVMRSKRFAKLFHRKIILPLWGRVLLSLGIIGFFVFYFMQLPQEIPIDEMRKNRLKADKEAYEWEQKLKMKRDNK
jgi:hypothetical protein